MSLAASQRRILSRPGSDSWRDRALCQYTDPEVFFPEHGENIDPARKVCLPCPVREQCLKAALEGPATELGVWGGFGERARRVIGRQYREGALLADIIAADDERFYALAEKRQASRRRLSQDPARMRRQRKAAGLNVSQAATLAGIRANTLSDLERARTSASAKTLAALAAVYGCEAAALKPAPEESPSEKAAA